MTASIHCTFDEFVDTLAPSIGALCVALRATISELHPNRVETVLRRQGIASYGIGAKRLSDHYAFVSPEDGWVRLGFYRGAFLHDRAAALIGRGPRVRHLRIESREEAADETLKRLLREAISERMAARA